MQISDLINLTTMVAEGLHDRSRSQQNFPASDNAQFKIETALAHPNTRFGWPCRLMIVIRLDCLPDDSVTVVRPLPGTKRKSCGLRDLDVTLIASPTGCLIQSPPRRWWGRRIRVSGCTDSSRPGGQRHAGDGR